MFRLALKCFGSAILVLVLSTIGNSNAQFADPYEQLARSGTAMGVAINFLEHERYRISIDLVRSRKNVKLVLAGQSITQDNVNSFGAENERKLKILTDEMKRRGFSAAAGQYTVHTYVGKEDSLGPCAAPEDRFGPLTIVQDNSAIEFRDAAGKLSGYGVIVEGTIAVVPGARDQLSPRAIIGVVEDTKIFLSLYDKSRAAVTPSASTFMCRIGYGTRIDPNTEQVGR